MQYENDISPIYTESESYKKQTKETNKQKNTTIHEYTIHI